MLIEFDVVSTINELPAYILPKALTSTLAKTLPTALTLAPTNTLPAALTSALANTLPKALTSASANTLPTALISAPESILPTALTLPAVSSPVSKKVATKAPLIVISKLPSAVPMLAWLLPLLILVALTLAPLMLLM